MSQPRARSKHDPRACRLPRRQRIKHGLLFKAAVRFYDWITCDGLWPTFRARFPELAALIEHEKRATRSDLRESIALVAWSCFARMDVKSLRVGRRQRYSSTDGRTFDFMGLPRETIARWTQLAESTVSRALTILRRGDIIAGPGHDGYNVIPQPVEACPVTPKTPAGVRGLPAIRRFFEHVFERLGLADTLNLCRRPPATPAPDERREVDARNVVEVRRLVEALARALGPPPVPG